MNIQTYNPSYYKITVWFKPEGVPRYKATEKRKVEFEVEEELSRSEYYKIAKKEATSQGTINSYGMSHWEAYKINIRIPDECRNRTIRHNLL